MIITAAAAIEYCDARPKLGKLAAPTNKLLPCNKSMQTSILDGVLLQVHFSQEDIHLGWCPASSARENQKTLDVVPR